MPRAQSKTVDVMLPLSRSAATRWLRSHAIPFTHMRELSGGGVAFRIRRGYLTDFQHQRKVPNPRPRVRGSKRVLRSRRQFSMRRRNAVRANRRTYETVVNGLRVRWFQGYADDIRYTREADGKKYSHLVETDAAELYLCEHPSYGHCILIADPSGTTPLWK